MRGPYNVLFFVFIPRCRHFTQFQRNSNNVTINTNTDSNTSLPFFRLHQYHLTLFPNQHHPITTHYHYFNIYFKHIHFNTIHFFQHPFLHAKLLVVCCFPYFSFPLFVFPFPFFRNFKIFNCIAVYIFTFTLFQLVFR